MSTFDQAFPSDPTLDGRTAAPKGGDLRDSFALAAMQAIIGMDNARLDSGEKLALPNHAEIVAQAAYKMADQMLKAREA